MKSALLIGAVRSGSTSCFYGAAQHPDIFVPAQKELDFWLRDDAGALPHWLSPAVANRVPATLEDYLRHFAAARPNQATFDASPNVFYDHGAAARVRTALPDARIVAVLRQPVDLCWSAWCAHLGGQPPLHDATGQFVAALERPPTAYPLMQYGMQAWHLEPWLAQFPASQVLVMLFDDLRDAPDKFFARLFAHIGVDWAQVTPRRMNRTGSPRAPLLHRLLNDGVAAKRWARAVLPAPAVRLALALHHRLREVNLQPPPGLPSWLRAELTELFYADDLRRLERLLDRDLSLWRVRERQVARARATSLSPGCQSQQEARQRAMASPAR